MKYMLLIYSNPANWGRLPEAEQAALNEAYGTFTQEIMASGEFVNGDPLGDLAASTTVRVRGGSPEITDGPYLEAKEHLVGYFTVDCKDLDRALVLAGQIPDAALGAIEVRPVMDMGTMET